MADGGGAERLGARLLAGEEVEECGLSELLASLYALIVSPGQNKIFNIPELDALLPVPQPAPAPPQQQQQHQRSDDDTWHPDNEPTQHEPRRIPKKEIHRPNVLELVSPPAPHHPSPAGKTALLHLILTHAILPPSLCSVDFSGSNAAVILIDPLHHFSVSFLATTIISHVISRFREAGKDVSDEAVQKEIQHCVKRALAHVHIFRPASWESLLATTRGLEAYLFDNTRHESTHRVIHSIILEDVDAFIPALRSTPPTAGGGNALATASAQLTRELDKLANLLSCVVITSSRSTTQGSFRPPLPLSWPPGMQVTRLAVRRVEVLKFAPGISVEEAEQERTQRWGVVSRGRFEVGKVGQGRDGEGFVFRVGRGVGIEKGTG